MVDFHQYEDSFAKLYRYPKVDTPYPLGRQIEHDPVSRRYSFPWSTFSTHHTVLWGDTAPVLAQGEIASCTGNAAANLLNTEMFGPARNKKTHGSFLTEEAAIHFYQLATHLDGFGPEAWYPPHDEGSTAIGVAKAMLSLGYIDSFAHCFGMDHALAAIQKQPVLVGTVWTEEMFHVNDVGLVTVGALNDKTVLGGHQYMCRGVNFQTKLLVMRNSWGPGWGGGSPDLYPGEFHLTFRDFERLLHEQGDVVVPQSNLVST